MRGRSVTSHGFRLVVLELTPDDLARWLLRQMPVPARTQGRHEKQPAAAFGVVVFQFAWEAVGDMAGDEISEDMPWPPYQGNAQARARQAYQGAGGDPAELPDAVWGNPVRTLFAYLTDPDQTRWLRRAEAAVAGLFTSPSRMNREKLTERVVVSLLGQPLVAAGDGPIGLSRVTDENGCVVTIILDPQAKNEQNPLGDGPR